MPFQPDFKTLPKNQRLIWNHLAPAKDLDFCLYGGTALALRMGHRESIDYDFFCAKPLDKVKLAKAIPLLSNVVMLQDEPNAFVALATPPEGSDPVKLSFFGGIEFGRVARPELTADGVLLAASTRDLMATKLKVLFDRVELKDYIDIADMLTAGVSLTQGLSDARALFSNFSPGICLRTLCYFDMPELDALDKKRKATLASFVKKVSNENAFEPSAIISESLVLNPKDLAKERELAHAMTQQSAVSKPKLTALRGESKHSNPDRKAPN